MDHNKDAKAISEISRILRPGGTLICTIPFAGKSRVTKPLQNVYDRTSLEELFSGWEKADELFYELRSNGY